MKKFTIRLPSLLAFILAILLGSALFWVSQQVQQLERAKNNLIAEKTNEEEGIRVLNAEWDYLNRPDRLETLVSRHLRTLEQTKPEDLLYDAKAVPEPALEEDENPQPVMVSTETSSKATKPAKKKIIDTSPARPIEDKQSNGADEFNHVLDTITAGEKDEP
ncbi:MAG: energy transducer TonB [Pseudobdellovibrionaceae bacterium]